MLEITFGMALDGTRWDGGPASIGKMKCGPLGMLKFLETRYALGGAEVSQFERIDAYAKKIKAADCEWCRESLRIDPWSTASTLLAWRDELVALKWDCKKGGNSVRLSALAEIEQSGPDLPLGHIDRLLALASTAKKKKVAAKLMLADAYEDIPLIWREVLKACFDEWEQIPAPESGRMPQITLVRGVNEISVARDLARYLSAGGDDRVAVISEWDTQTLDIELKRLGLPTFGVSVPSCQRKSLQELIRALSEFGRTRSAEEYPNSEIISVLDGVTKTLKADIERNPLSKLASAHVAALKAALGSMTSVRRSALWRMVEKIVGEGAGSPYSTHELGAAPFLRSPGALLEEVDNALWWMFVPSAVRSGILFRKEEQELFVDPATGVDVIKDERTRQNRLEERAWTRLLARVKNNLILFVPDVIAEDAAGIHPFYDVLAGKSKSGADIKEVRSSDLQNSDMWSLAGREVELEEGAASHPEFSVEYTVVPDKDLAPKSLSPTQLESLLSCPFQWYHKYHLGLTPSDAAKSETTKTRQGNMAHKMVELLIGSSATNEADVEAHFPGLFAEYCGKMIPEYAEPDRKMECDSYRKKLLSSLIALWRLMHEKGLRPVESEYKFKEKDFCGVPFSGKADLILEDEAGGRHIIDFKWSSSKVFAEKIKEGTSVQLAAYDWLSGFGSKSGYYLFPKEKFFENTQDNRNVWKNVVATYIKRLERMRSGYVDKAVEVGLDVHASVSDKEDRRGKIAELGLSVDIHAACRFCDFKGLCGMLWEEGGAE